ncbi:MAG: thioredoxin family protein [candidate division Zixibacteria bacterium]|nr:thioredoxin family protein [candidate division Zixibacteria bacterium]
MRRLTKIGIVSLVLALIAGLAAIAQTGTQDVAIGGVAIDQPAPDFTLKDLDGKEYKLSSFKGKYVVLEWVNFDCPFVKKHYSSGNMQALQAEATKKGVIWLSICSSAPGKQGHFPIADLKKRIATEKAVPTAYLIDENGVVGKLYGAKTTPHMFVIDSIGKLRYAGAIDDMPSTKVDDIPKATNYVRAALDAVTNGRAVAVKSQTPYGCAVKF